VICCGDHRSRSLRFEADELGDDVAESLESSLGRPALQDEVLPFNMTEVSQAQHEGPGGGVNRLRSRHLRDRRRGEDEADAIDLPGLLVAQGNDWATPLEVVESYKTQYALATLDGDTERR